MPKILHFHLPKTGGSAIRHHLMEQMGASHVSPTVLGMRLKDALLRWEGIDAISGHFSVHQADRIPPDRCALTVLRDPIDRFLSEYFFAKSDNAGRLLDSRKHAMDLDAYLESLSPLERAASSLQIEMLYPLGTHSQSPLSSDEKLAASVRALDLFKFIGIQDELEDFASMLDVSFSWPARPLKQINVTSLRFHVDSLKPHQRHNLHKMLEREFELYQQARSRFRRDRRRFITRALTTSSIISESSKTTDPTNSQSVTANVPSDFGDMRCEIKSVSVSGEISGRDCVATGEQMTILINFLANEIIDTLNVGIAVKDERGLLIFGTNSMLLGNAYSLVSGLYTVHFRMLNRLAQGRYSVDVSLVRTLSHHEDCYHWLEQAAFFDVNGTAVSHFDGRFLMDADVEMISVSGEASWSLAPRAQLSYPIFSQGRINKPLEKFASIITPMCQLEKLDSGARVLLPMRVENLGREVWPTFGQQPVVLSYRWLTLDGAVIVADGLRTRLPSDIPPGGAVIIPLQVVVPDEKVDCRLLVSLVQEGVVWFAESDQDSACVRLVSIV
ncbi:MAG: Wzt carbohydrate-binding domain-containing protein [Rhodanobacter sp.]|jgi:hypothetical protein